MDQKAARKAAKASNPEHIGTKERLKKTFGLFRLQNRDKDTQEPEGHSMPENDNQKAGKQAAEGAVIGSETSENDIKR